MGTGTATTNLLTPQIYETFFFSHFFGFLGKHREHFIYMNRNDQKTNFEILDRSMVVDQIKIGSKSSKIREEILNIGINFRKSTKILY